MTSKDIKALLQSGKIDQASEACAAELKEHPDNLELKLLYGTCRQLLGDTAAFQRIHDELAPTLDPLEAANHSSCLVDQWRNYKKALRYLTAAGLVFAASAFLCGCYGVPAYNRPYDSADETPASVANENGTSLESPHESAPRQPPADSRR